jgi:hypothetical protein
MKEWKKSIKRTGGREREGREGREMERGEK